MNIETLTKEQKEMYQHGYIFSLSEKGKLKVEEPKIINDYVRNRRIQKINQIFQNTINQITAGYSQAEQKGWDLQLQEAKKILAGKKSVFLQKICNENGKDIIEFAKRIVNKAEQFSLAYATALGIKQAKLKKLEK